MHDYTGFSFPEIDELLVTEYMLYLRDGVIHHLMQTDKGKEYLKKCWILEQTKPDRKLLRERFGKERAGK